MKQILCIGNYNPYSKVNQLHDHTYKIHYQIKKILKKINIEYVIFPCKYINGTNIKLLWIRDLFINLNNDIQLLKCDKIIRENNHIIMQKLFQHDAYNNKRIMMYQTNESTLIEGGDIIEYKNILFIGLSKRTNMNGILFLEKQLNKNNNKKIITIKHNALHLDCVFNILPRENTIIYCSSYIPSLNKKQIQNVAKIDNFITIESIVRDKRLNLNLVTNYLYIYPNHIIISFITRFQSFYDFLKKLNYNLHFIDFKNFERFDGSIRCFTQWITISKQQNLL